MYAGRWWKVTARETRSPITSSTPCADALSVQLDTEVMEQLDRIWPGPGEAPQAYAW